MGYDNPIVDREDRRKYPSGEATRFYKPSKGAKQMSRVVYRGVEYDTEVRRQAQQQQQQQPQQYEETYRGVKFVKENK